MGREFTGIRVVSETTIEIAFTYCGIRCRERLKLKPTPANLKATRRHREAILDAITHGTFDYAHTFPDSPRSTQFSAEPGARISTKDYLGRWVNRLESELKASTFLTYRRIVNNQLIPQFGAKALTDVKWRDVRDWIRQKDGTSKTIGNILSVLRTALDEAVEDELIDNNPLAGKKIRRKGILREDEIDPFSGEEREAIINAATGQERNLIQFAFWTGMRISEFCALDWNVVDWLNSTIRVNKALTQPAKVSEVPKTSASIRDVKLLAPALSALQDQKTHTYLKGEEIFQNPRTGERWTGDLVIRKRMWTRILKKAKVRYRYPYQMRHTYASMMLMAGESPQWVAMQMGHTDWTFTARTYSRFIPDDAPDAGEKAVERWGNAGKTSLLRSAK